MDTRSASPLHGSCECGTCTFEARKPPKARFICHCTICQEFTGKPFSDVTVLRATDVSVVNEEQISFKKYRPPPNISRGLCRCCGKPAIETMGAGPLKLIFIPSANFKDRNFLPPAKLHIFYNRRQKDHGDQLPKYEGYLSSQFAVGRLLMRGL